MIDRLGAPGDALITANVIRCVKENYPNVKINCITPHPELIRLDPSVEIINQPETFYSFDSTYWELIVRKEKSQNIIEHNMLRLGIDKYEYKAAYYLSEEEKDWAKQETNQFDKPILAICTRSKEPVKNWPQENWLELIQNLKANFSIIQLGDDKEPTFEGVHRYAGKLSMRESAAILSNAGYFMGPDSLLMHIANGLDIPSTIIFGGSRPVSCFGYSENINLSSAPECSPCWIHEGYESCDHDLRCMKEIKPLEALPRPLILN
ncbi:glycosyltransferase family 9 protein [Opitutales bacterium]|nr:glycosyltransferase family 9 protein [Opitutales bacterium]